MENVFSQSSIVITNEIPGDIRCVLRYLSSYDKFQNNLSIWFSDNWVFVHRGNKELWSSREIEIFTHDIVESGIVDPWCVFLLDSVVLPSQLNKFDEPTTVILFPRDMIDGINDE